MARRLAGASTTAPALNPVGILQEPCGPSGSCEPDGPSFKGIYARGRGRLDAVLADHPYTGYLRSQAADDRDALDMYGLRWAGPLDRTDAARQHSAVDLLNAVH